MARSTPKKPTPPKAAKPLTKLKKVLISKGMSYLDLKDAIWDNFNELYGTDRISNIANGRTVNCTMRTYLIIAESLQVPLNDIVDRDLILKKFKQGK